MVRVSGSLVSNKGNECQLVLIMLKLIKLISTANSASAVTLPPRGLSLFRFLLYVYQSAI